MQALSSRPFCSCDSRGVSLRYLAAGCRYTALLSMAFSLVGVGVILRLESTARVLIPHWEDALPPEARSRWSPGAPPSSSTVAPTDLEAARAVDTPRRPGTAEAC